MPSVTYVTQNGTTKVVTVPAGTTVMQAAVNNGVGGIVGECGGNCLCATCHVYVREDFVSRLVPPNSEEALTIQGVMAEHKPNSRLSCQIRLTDALDGLVVTVPATQY